LASLTTAKAQSTQPRDDAVAVEVVGGHGTAVLVR